VGGFVRLRGVRIGREVQNSWVTHEFGWVLEPEIDKTSLLAGPSPWSIVLASQCEKGYKASIDYA